MAQTKSAKLVVLSLLILPFSVVLFQNCSPSLEGENDQTKSLVVGYDGRTPSSTTQGSAVSPTPIASPTPVVAASPTPPPCSGTLFNNMCLHLSVMGESCTQACANFGGDTQATSTVIGAAGTAKACFDALTALGLPTSTVPNYTAGLNCQVGAGCEYELYNGSYNSIRCVTPTTDSNVSYPQSQRACACAN